MKQLFLKQIKKSLRFVTLMVLSSSFALASFEHVDCVKNQKELGISTVECQALEALWESTDGKNWREKENWDTLTKVSLWEGIEVEKGRVISLLLYSNNLKGKLPSELGELDALKRVSFANNSLEGEIPSSLGNLSELVYLELSHNHLSGDIPVTLGSLSNLTELYINNNQVTGVIPNALGDLKNLQVLKLYENILFGSIPSTFGKLSNLEDLSLAENDLTGVIPMELGGLYKLVYLNLQSNQLSGEIPSSLGNLENLTGLYLQENRLIGNIPSQLGELVALKDLDISNNDLNGTLPSSLGNLSSLTYLNVENNKLSGDIPSEFLNLVILDYLNLKGNRFVSSNVESIQSELLYIPNYSFSFYEDEENREDNISIENETFEKKSSNTIAKKNLFSIQVLNEDEVASLDVATLKIVGTEEAGDALFVENEGTWSIEDDTISFTALKGFHDVPTSIFYTIEDGNGVRLDPVKVFIKRVKGGAYSINVWEEDSKNIQSNLVTIVLPKDFYDKYPESFLNKYSKMLSVDMQGTWKVETNGTLVFYPDEEFTGTPANIEYVISSKEGNKLAVGLVDMQESSDTSNNVGLFGIKGLLLMILFGGLFGMFYIREIENKKV